MLSSHDTVHSLCPASAADSLQGWRNTSSGLSLGAGPGDHSVVLAPFYVTMTTFPVLIIINKFIDFR